MPPQVKKLLSLLFILALVAGLGSAGCSGIKDKWRRVSGTRAPDIDLEEEAKVPPETIKEEVIIDGKTWVKSKNPNYPSMPNEPEFVYAEKGKEFKSLTDMFMASVARKFGYDKKAQEAKGVSPDKLQELVRQEVDRILREQGLKALSSQEKGQRPGVVGRSVAVYPNPESDRSMEGQNRTLAANLADYLAKLKDLTVASPEKVKASLSKAQATGDLNQRQNLQALADNLGVQALILTRVVPATGKNPNFLVMELYDTFKGTKVNGIAYPEEGKPDTASIKRFVQNNGLRLSASLMEIDWFGRVEFIKERNVYLSLGESTGLKVGDRLKVVTPGKEVVNPATRAMLGVAGDESQGDLKITELLGNTGAVAQVLSGGPFKPNDKVKKVK